MPLIEKVDTFIACKHADSHQCAEIECLGNKACPDYKPVIEDYTVVPVYPVKTYFIRKEGI